MQDDLGGANHDGRWGMTTNPHTMKAGSRLPSEAPMSTRENGIGWELKLFRAGSIGLHPSYSVDNLLDNLVRLIKRKNGARNIA